MTLDRELEVPSAERNLLPRKPFQIASPSALKSVAIFAGLLTVVLVLQVLSGAYHAEFGTYSDESAHYVTSLMVREYILHPSASPIAFARNYYHHYPTVAIGHWPPFFYLVQGLWTVLFSASRVSVLLQLAFTSALLGFSVYREARRWFEFTGAALAGLLTVCVPLVQAYTAEEMAETLLALLCFWSVIYLARYIELERWQDSVGFGVFFALAVLTKGSGWLLALVPPVALVLTRKLHLLRRFSFWLSALLVAVL